MYMYTYIYTHMYKILFVCVCIYVCVCTIYVQKPTEVRRRHEYKVIGGCDPPRGCRELNPGPLQEQ